MKWIRQLGGTALAVVMAGSLAATARAADYAFLTDAPQDYYGGTS